MNKMVRGAKYLINKFHYTFDQLFSCMRFLGGWIKEICNRSSGWRWEKKLPFFLMAFLVLLIYGKANQWNNIVTKPANVVKDNHI